MELDSCRWVAIICICTAISEVINEPVLSVA